MHLSRHNGVICALVTHSECPGFRSLSGSCRVARFLQSTLDGGGRVPWSRRQPHSLTIVIKFYCKDLMRQKQLRAWTLVVRKTWSERNIRIPLSDAVISYLRKWCYSCMCMQTHMQCQEGEHGYQLGVLFIAKQLPMNWDDNDVHAPVCVRPAFPVFQAGGKSQLPSWCNNPCDVSMPRDNSERSHHGRSSYSSSGW